MKTNPGWLNQTLSAAFEAESTSAYRLCTIKDGWVERFGSDVLISFKTDAARERLVREFDEWRASTEVSFNRAFQRFLPKRQEERSAPSVVSGGAGENRETIATENGLKYGIDFSAGYSVGLFMDQRE